MKKVWALIRIQGKSLFRQPSVVLAFFVLPIMGALFISFGLQPLFTAKPFISPFDVAIADLDQSMETKMIIQQLATSDEFEGVVQFHSIGLEEGLAMIEDDKVAALVVIPENFAGAMRKGRNKPFELVGNPLQPFQYGLFLTTMESAAALISAAQTGVNTIHHFLESKIDDNSLAREVDKAIFEFTLQSLGRRQVISENKLFSTGAFTLKEYYIAAGSVILTLSMGVYLLTIVRQDYSAAIDKRLLSRGLGAGAKIGAKFFSFFSAFIFLIAIILTLYIVALRGDITGSWPSLLLVLPTIAASAAMFFTFLSSIGMHPFGELTVSAFLSLILMVLGGNILPLSFLPQWMGTLGQVTLTYWMREGFLYSAFITDKRIIFTSVGVMAVIISLLLAASFWAESRLRRRSQ